MRRFVAFLVIKFCLKYLQSLKNETCATNHALSCFQKDKTLRKKIE